MEELFLLNQDYIGFKKIYNYELDEISLSSWILYAQKHTHIHS